jgi:hypothetical protein
MPQAPTENMEQRSCESEILSSPASGSRDPKNIDIGV